MNKNTCCEDCKRPYGDEHGFPDLIIDDEIWKQISPNKDESGLLCPSCICRRLHEQGFTNVAHMIFVEFCVQHTPTPQWQYVTDDMLTCHMIRFENLSEELPRYLCVDANVPVVNESNNIDNYMDLYDVPGMLALATVTKKYWEDFHRFGYHAWPEGKVR